MINSLLEYFESSDIVSSLVKMEEIEINIHPYRIVWDQSKSQLMSDFSKTVSIHPKEWFGEAISIISQFDYVQISHNSYITYSEDGDLKMCSFRSEARRFSNLEEINQYLTNTRSNFKRTALQSINKLIIISDDFKTNQIVWIIRSSEFDFNIKIQRDKKINQILN